MFVKSNNEKVVKCNKTLVLLDFNQQATHNEKKSYSIVSNTKHGLNIICGVPEIVLLVHVNSWIMNASLLAYELRYCQAVSVTPLPSEVLT